MTFVNLSLLAGTALIALPIVLHLIMRRRPTLLEFPALQFIQKRHDANRRRLQLRHLILLLLRAGAIALLAFALARPTVKLAGAIGNQEAPVAAALVFDTAPRMEYRQQNQTRLEAGRDFGLWLLAQLPEESEIAVLDTRVGSAAAFQVDRGAARQRIARLEPAANSQSLPQAIRSALTVLGESDLPRKEVYVFTDLSRGAWPEQQAAALEQQLGEFSDLGIYVIDVGVANPTDYGLDELRLSGDVLSSRSTLTVETSLWSTGAAASRNVELHLLDSAGKPQKRSQETCEAAPGELCPVEFRIGGLEPGTHQGFVRIVGQDGLAANDTRYFTVAVRPAWRILIAAPPPAESYALFLSEALAPDLYRKRGQARFECDITNLKELGSRPLAEYAGICLLDPTPLSPAIWRKLGDFAAEGKGVAIFLGRNALPLDAFNAAAAQELLPGKLLRQVRRLDGSLHLAPRDYQHPILRALHGQSGSIPWDAFPVFRYWELDKLVAGAGSVLPYNDGRPAILQRTVGRGRVLTMTTPVSDRPTVLSLSGETASQTPSSQDAWNLLPVGEAWPFVILANQIAAYLVGSGEQQLNYLAGQTVVLSLEGAAERGSYLLFTPDGLSFPVSADQKRHELVVTATDQAGNYRVRAGGSAGVDLGFSVNSATDQTRLERMNKEELASIFGSAKVQIARTRQQVDRDISLGRVGQELFPLLILGVALALGLEMVVANRFYRT
jgi:hypothetical protein